MCRRQTSEQLDRGVDPLVRHQPGHRHQPAALWQTATRPEGAPRFGVRPPARGVGAEREDANPPFGRQVETLQQRAAELGRPLRDGDVHRGLCQDRAIQLPLEARARQLRSKRQQVAAVDEDAVREAGALPGPPCREGGRTNVADPCETRRGRTTEAGDPVRPTHQPRCRAQPVHRHADAVHRIGQRRVDRVGAGDDARRHGQGTRRIAPRQFVHPARDAPAEGRKVVRQQEVVSRGRTSHRPVGWGAQR